MPDDLAPFTRLAPQRLVSADDLAAYPNYYALGIDGDDMLPFVPDDATLAICKCQPPHAGDVVLLWRDPDRIEHDAHQAQVGMLASNLPPFLTLPWVQPADCSIEPVVIIERTNPPRRFVIPASSVLAIHKAIGLFPGPNTPGGSHPFDTLIPFASVLS